MWAEPMIEVQPQHPDWRNGRAYEHLAGLPGPSLAWEFLRRNDAYRRAAPKGNRPDDGTRNRIIVLNPQEARFFARWGLIFRGSAYM